MIILFAPSEAKKSGGELPSIDASAFIFPDYFEKRFEMIDAYRKVIADEKNLGELFGIANPKEFNRYRNDILKMPTMKAIERYDGVAYEHLGYETLSLSAQSYLDEKTILFSNLFGPISAGDRIPDYKVKQGSSIGSELPDKHYKSYFSKLLDQRIGDEEVLDLRAGYYDKFYIPANRVTTLKFLKEGKVVSHWAKAYRGVILRHLALHNVTSIQELPKMQIKGLRLLEIKESKKKIELVYAIE